VATQSFGSSSLTSAQPLSSIAVFFIYEDRTGRRRSRPPSPQSWLISSTMIASCVYLLISVPVGSLSVKLGLLYVPMQVCIFTVLCDNPTAFSHIKSYPISALQPAAFLCILWKIYGILNSTSWSASLWLIIVIVSECTRLHYTILLVSVRKCH
jgi:hypothetical protein